jgi:VRR-NUC domain
MCHVRDDEDCGIAHLDASPAPRRRTPNLPISSSRESGATTVKNGAAITETMIQRAVFDHLRARGARGVFAFHPRNGSQDQRRLAGINAGLGVVAGVPDVVVIKDGVPYALELKTETGRLSRDQARVIRELQAVGVDAGVAYGLDEAIRWLEERGILRGCASLRHAGGQRSRRSGTSAT